MELKGAEFVNTHARLKEYQKAYEISANLGDKIDQSRKKLKIRKLAITISWVALLTSGVTFGLVKSQQKTPIFNLIQEMEIHTNNGTTPDGRFVNPNLDHDCVIEGKGFVGYAKENGFNEVQIRRMMEIYGMLKSGEADILQFEDGMNNVAKK